MDIERPPYMNDKFFDRFSTDSDKQTLRSHSPYLYEAVLKICQASSDEQLITETKENFVKIFIQRFLTIFNHSNSASHTQEFTLLAK